MTTRTGWRSRRPTTPWVARSGDWLEHGLNDRDARPARTTSVCARSTCYRSSAFLGVPRRSSAFLGVPRRSSAFLGVRRLRDLSADDVDRWLADRAGHLSWSTVLHAALGAQPLNQAGDGPGQGQARRGVAVLGPGRSAGAAVEGAHRRPGRGRPRGGGRHSDGGLRRHAAPRPWHGPRSCGPGRGNTSTCSAGRTSTRRSRRTCTSGGPFGRTATPSRRSPRGPSLSPAVWRSCPTTGSCRSSGAATVVSRARRPPRVLHGRRQAARYRERSAGLRSAIAKAKGVTACQPTTWVRTGRARGDISTEDDLGGR